jgi:putative membrane protein
MNIVLVIVGIVLVSVAAALHVVIFSLESVRWSKPSTWRAFGIKTQTDADVVSPMAFNQGFYNLFLAGGIVVGLALATVAPQAGFAIVFFAAISMVLAATVLISTSPKFARPALLQGLPPLLGVIALAFGLVAG